MITLSKDDIDRIELLLSHLIVAKFHLKNPMMSNDHIDNALKYIEKADKLIIPIHNSLHRNEKNND